MSARSSRRVRSRKSRQRKNVLFILMDDVGIEMLGVYGAGPDQPLTPTIDDLAQQGMLFRNVWCNPVTVTMGWAILRQIMRKQRVNFDTVCASLSVYIMIGVVFATLYYGMARQLMNPDRSSTSAFSGLTAKLEDPDDPEEWRAELAYFSYVTMTTLGYGEITPTHDSTRSFAILQAIIGQIYLLTLVAGLVGMQFAGDRREMKEEPADSTPPPS